MKKRIRDALISGALYLIILFSPMANGTGQVDFGGKLDDGDLSIITSVDYSWPAGKFERDIEFDYRYKESKDIQTKNEGLIGLKQRLEFKPKQYVFGLVRYDFNEFREIKYRTQADVGWGYKILRTDLDQKSHRSGPHSKNLCHIPCFHLQCHLDHYPNYQWIYQGSLKMRSP